MERRREEVGKRSCEAGGQRGIGVMTDEGMQDNREIVYMI